MEPSGRLMAKVPLENGLTVYFYDQSRPVASGRWQVQLLVDVPLHLEQALFHKTGDSELAFTEFAAAHGDTIHFQQTKVRNFIAHDNAQGLLDSMKNDFLRTNATYLANPDFRAKYVLKRYFEWKQATACRDAHTQALLRAERDEP